MKEWQPINTAPVGEFVLVTGGGLPGAIEIVIGRLRDVGWQFLGLGGPFGGPKYWMSLPPDVP
jgi:hypothetical protein